MQVNLRRRDAFVPESHLGETEVAGLLIEPGRKGVAKAVDGVMVGDPGSLEPVIKSKLHLARADAVTLV